MKWSSLRLRIALGLAMYSALLGSAILWAGHEANERVESLLWQSLLAADFDHLMFEHREHPQRDLPNSAHFHVYVAKIVGERAEVPEFARDLTPGMHDEVEFGDEEYAVMVRDHGADRLFAILDISQLEADEEEMSLLVGLFWLAMIVMLIVVVWWLSGRLLSPITRLIVSIDGLRPDNTGQRVELDQYREGEVRRIATSINGLLDKIDGYVSREHYFLDTASHELRTPIAVISGASELLQDPQLPERLRPAAERIRRSVQDMEQLVWTLLMLARSPDRVNEGSSEFDLGELVAEIVEDHSHLLTQQALTLDLQIAPGCRLFAPPRLAQIAISNLLRNAIENSNAGAITVTVSLPAQLEISDPGHGMTPDEVGALYSRMARQHEHRSPRGIGINLIMRICEHMGWELDVNSEQDCGTQVVLKLLP